jgi:leader peptidase (prepilin peptidase)/N-methyltransferase
MHIDFNFFCVLISAWLVGSVLNMIIYRLPIMLDFKEQPHQHFKTFNLFMPRSHCPSCGNTIAWYYNIPIMSYLMLMGKCPNCKTSIPFRYPLIEISYILICLFTYWQYRDSAHFISVAWFSALLLVQSFIDFELFLLPDIISYLLLWSGLFINSFGLFCSLHDAVYGAIFAYLGLWIFYHLFAKLTGKKGFGYGDFKLYAAISAWLGIEKIFICIMLSCIIGIFFGAIIFITRKEKKEPQIVPFGPALAIAGFILIFLPDIEINQLLEF